MFCGENKRIKKRLIDLYECDINNQEAQWRTHAIPSHLSLLKRVKISIIDNIYSMNDKIIELYQLLDKLLLDILYYKNEFERKILEKTVKLS